MSIGISYDVKTNKESLGIFSIYNDDYKQMYSHSIYKSESCIGQFLVDFLYIDFKEIDLMMDATNCVSLKDNVSSLKDNILSLKSTFGSIFNNYYTLKSIKDEVIEKISSYEKAFNDYWENNADNNLYENVKKTFNQIKNVVFHCEMLQKKYIAAASYCLDPENKDFEKLNSLQRFCLFENNIDSSTILPDGKEFHVSYIPRPSTEIVLFDKSKEEAIKIIKPINIEFFEVFSGDINNICYIELIKMVQCNIAIKRCLHCGKYFINNKYKNSLYCDRVPPGETKPCYVVAPRKNYEKKLQDDLVAAEYRKRYKKLFGRIKNSPVPEEEKERFDKWKSKAEPFRDKASKENMDIEEFKKEMDDIERSVKNGRKSKKTNQ